ncbi:MAG: ABC transporter permease, partial [Desulfurococcaceae archaeon]
VASLADIGSLLVYFGTLITALGSRFVTLFDINLIILHALVGFLTILVTVSISIPFISRTRGIRTASNIASLFSVIGLAFFVSGWIIDFYRLPTHVLTLLCFVPYTYSILSIQSYVYGDYWLTAFSLSALVMLSTIILLASLWRLEREKILLAT